MPRLPIMLLVTLLIPIANGFADWLKISNVNIWNEETELAGPKIVIDYDLEDESFSEATPAYVFVHFRKNTNDEWKLLPSDELGGNGSGIVEQSGPKKIIWWGASQRILQQIDALEFQVRGLHLITVPGGQFVRRSLPGDGRDQSGRHKQTNTLPTYYLAKYETTVGMYVDYLNAIGSDGTGFHEKMSNPKRCGIVRDDTGNYTVAPGRSKYPVTYVSWYDAQNFLKWCGLRLPTEAEWEKASSGGLFLDGDALKKSPNPIPDRLFPWGNALPNADGVFRCNFDTEEDGYSGLAPVGSFSQFNSPYGACDMAGNVKEWTQNWYTTQYHSGLDGYRVVRGGSWLDVPEGCDGISGATTLPLKESSIMGFRGALTISVTR